MQPRIRAHRWWLALLAMLLTPWPGPHIDAYLPVGWVLLRVGGEEPDAGFWLLAVAVLAIGYAAWVALLTGVAALFGRRRRDRDAGGSA